MSTKLGIASGCLEKIDKGLIVTRFCGAAVYGTDRARVQLTCEDYYAGYSCLDRNGARQLINLLVECFGTNVLPEK